MVRICEEDTNRDVMKDCAGKEAKKDKRGRTTTLQLEATYRIRTKVKALQTEKLEG